MYKEEDFPICEECGERIYDDRFLEIGFGEYYHEKCVTKVYLETWLANHGHDYGEEE